MLPVLILCVLAVAVRSCPSTTASSAAWVPRMAYAAETTPTASVPLAHCYLPPRLYTVNGTHMTVHDVPTDRVLYTLDATPSYGGAKSVACLSDSVLLFGSGVVVQLELRGDILGLYILRSTYEAPQAYTAANVTDWPLVVPIRDADPTQGLVPIAIAILPGYSTAAFIVPTTNASLIRNDTRTGTSLLFLRFSFSFNITDSMIGPPDRHQFVWTPAGCVLYNGYEQLNTYCFSASAPNNVTTWTNVTGWAADPLVPPLWHGVSVGPPLLDYFTRMNSGAREQRIVTFSFGRRYPSHIRIQSVFVSYPTMWVEDESGRLLFIVRIGYHALDWRTPGASVVDLVNNTVPTMLMSATYTTEHDYPVNFGDDRIFGSLLATDAEFFLLGHTPQPSPDVDVDASNVTVAYLLPSYANNSAVADRFEFTSSFTALAGNETTTTFTPNMFWGLQSVPDVTAKYTGVYAERPGGGELYVGMFHGNRSGIFTRRFVLLPSAPLADVRINGACVARTDGGQDDSVIASRSSPILVAVSGLPQGIDAVRARLGDTVLEHQVDPATRTVSFEMPVSDVLPERTQMSLDACTAGAGCQLRYATVALTFTGTVASGLPRANATLLSVSAATEAARVITCPTRVGSFALLTSRYDRLYTGCANSTNWTNFWRLDDPWDLAATSPASPLAFAARGPASMALNRHTGTTCRYHTRPLPFLCINPYRTRTMSSTFNFGSGGLDAQQVALVLVEGFTDLYDVAVAVSYRPSTTRLRVQVLGAMPPLPWTRSLYYPGILWVETAGLVEWLVPLASGFDLDIDDAIRGVSVPVQGGRGLAVFAMRGSFAVVRIDARTGQPVIDGYRLTGGSVSERLLSMDVVADPAAAFTAVLTETYDTVNGSLVYRMSRVLDDMSVASFASFRLPYLGTSRAGVSARGGLMVLAGGAYLVPYAPATLVPRPDLVVNLSAAAPLCTAFAGLNADGSKSMCVLANGSLAIQSYLAADARAPLRPVYRGPELGGWSAALSDEHPFFSLGTGTECTNSSDTSQPVTYVLPLFPSTRSDTSNCGVLRAPLRYAESPHEWECILPARVVSAPRPYQSMVCSNVSVPEPAVTIDTFPADGVQDTFFQSYRVPAVYYERCVAGVDASLNVHCVDQFTFVPANQSYTRQRFSAARNTTVFPVFYRFPYLDQQGVADYSARYRLCNREQLAFACLLDERACLAVDDKVAAASCDAAFWAAHDPATTGAATAAWWAAQTAAGNLTWLKPPLVRESETAVHEGTYDVPTDRLPRWTWDHADNCTAEERLCPGTVAPSTNCSVAASYSRIDGASLFRKVSRTGCVAESKAAADQSLVGVIAAGTGGAISVVAGAAVFVDMRRRAAERHRAGLESIAVTPSENEAQSLCGPCWSLAEGDTVPAVLRNDSGALIIDPLTCGCGLRCRPAADDLRPCAVAADTLCSADPNSYYAAVRLCGPLATACRYTCTRDSTSGVVTPACTAVPGTCVCPYPVANASRCLPAPRVCTVAESRARCGVYVQACAAHTATPDTVYNCTPLPGAVADPVSGRFDVPPRAAVVASVGAPRLNLSVAAVRAAPWVIAARDPVLALVSNASGAIARCPLVQLDCSVAAPGVASDYAYFTGAAAPPALCSGDPVYGGPGTGVVVLDTAARVPVFAPVLPTRTTIWPAVGADAYPAALSAALAALYDRYTDLAYYVSLTNAPPGSSRVAAAQATVYAAPLHVPGLPLLGAPANATLAALVPDLYFLRAHAALLPQAMRPAASATTPPAGATAAAARALLAQAAAAFAARESVLTLTMHNLVPGATYSLEIEYAVLAVPSSSFTNYTGVDVSFRVWIDGGVLDNTTELRAPHANRTGWRVLATRPFVAPAASVNVSVARVRPTEDDVLACELAVHARTPAALAVTPRAPAFVCRAAAAVDGAALRCVRDRTAGTAPFAPDVAGDRNFQGLRDCGLAFVNPTTASDPVSPVYRANGTDLLLLRSVSAAPGAWNFSAEREPLGTWLLPGLLLRADWSSGLDPLRRGGPAVVRTLASTTDTGFSVGYDETRQGAVLLFRAARRGLSWLTLPALALPPSYTVALWAAQLSLEYGDYATLLVAPASDSDWTAIDQGLFVYRGRLHCGTTRTTLGVSSNFAALRGASVPFGEADLTGWRHIACTCDSSTLASGTPDLLRTVQVYTLYLDGVAVAASTRILTSYSGTAAGAVRVGAYSPLGAAAPAVLDAQGTVGRIDSLTVYGRALAASEVAALAAYDVGDDDGTARLRFTAPNVSLVEPAWSTAQFPVRFDFPLGVDDLSLRFTPLPEPSNASGPAFALTGYTRGLWPGDVSVGAALAAAAQRAGVFACMAARIATVPRNTTPTACTVDTSVAPYVGRLAGAVLANYTNLTAAVAACQAALLGCTGVVAWNSAVYFTVADSAVLSGDPEYRSYPQLCAWDALHAACGVRPEVSVAPSVATRHATLVAAAAVPVFAPQARNLTNGLCFNVSVRVLDPHAAGTVSGYARLLVQCQSSAAGARAVVHDGCSTNVSDTAFAHVDTARVAATRPDTAPARFLIRHRLYLASTHRPVIDLGTGAPRLFSSHFALDCDAAAARVANLTTACTRAEAVAACGDAATGCVKTCALDTGGRGYRCTPQVPATCTCPGYDAVSAAAGLPPCTYGDRGCAGAEHAAAGCDRLLAACRKTCTLQGCEIQPQTCFADYNVSTTRACTPDERAAVCGPDVGGALQYRTFAWLTGAAPLDAGPVTTFASLDAAVDACLAMPLARCAAVVAVGAGTYRLYEPPAVAAAADGGVAVLARRGCMYLLRDSVPFNASVVVNGTNYTDLAAAAAACDADAECLGVTGNASLALVHAGASAAPAPFYDRTALCARCTVQQRRLRPGQVETDLATAACTCPLAVPAALNASLAAFAPWMLGVYADVSAPRLACACPVLPDARTDTLAARLALTGRCTGACRPCLPSETAARCGGYRGPLTSDPAATGPALVQSADVCALCPFAPAAAVAGADVRDCPGTYTLRYCAAAERALYCPASSQGCVLACDARGRNCHRWGQCSETRACTATEAALLCSLYDRDAPSRPLAQRSGVYRASTGDALALPAGAAVHAYTQSSVSGCTAAVDQTVDGLRVTASECAYTCASRSPVTGLCSTFVSNSSSAAECGHPDQVANYTVDDLGITACVCRGGWGPSARGACRGALVSTNATTEAARQTRWVGEYALSSVLSCDGGTPPGFPEATPLALYDFESPAAPWSSLGEGAGTGTMRRRSVSGNASYLAVDADVASLTAAAPRFGAAATLAASATHALALDWVGPRPALTFAFWWRPTTNNTNASAALLRSATGAGAGTPLPLELTHGANGTRLMMGVRWAGKTANRSVDTGATLGAWTHIALTARLVGGVILPARFFDETDEASPLDSRAACGTIALFELFVNGARVAVLGPVRLAADGCSSHFIGGFVYAELGCHVAPHSEQPEGAALLVSTEPHSVTWCAARCVFLKWPIAVVSATYCYCRTATALSSDATAATCAPTRDAQGFLRPASDAAQAVLRVGAPHVLSGLYEFGPAAAGAALDDVRVYGVALAEPQVRALYAADRFGSRALEPSEETCAVVSATCNGANGFPGADGRPCSSNTARVTIGDALAGATAPVSLHKVHVHPSAVTLINISAATAEQRALVERLCGENAVAADVDIPVDSSGALRLESVTGRRTTCYCRRTPRRWYTELERFGYSAEDELGTGRCLFTDRTRACDPVTESPLLPWAQLNADCAPFGGFQCRVLCSDDTEASCTRFMPQACTDRFIVGARCTPSSAAALCPLAQLASGPTPESFTCRATCMYDSRVAPRAAVALQKCDSTQGAYACAATFPTGAVTALQMDTTAVSTGAGSSVFTYSVRACAAGDPLKFCGPGAVGCTKRCLNAVTGDVCYAMETCTCVANWAALTLAQQTNLLLNASAAALGNVTPVLVQTAAGVPCDGVDAARGEAVAACGNFARSYSRRVCSAAGVCAPVCDCMPGATRAVRLPNELEEPLPCSAYVRPCDGRDHATRLCQAAVPRGSASGSASYTDCNTTCRPFATNASDSMANASMRDVFCAVDPATCVLDASAASATLATVVGAGGVQYQVPAENIYTILDRDACKCVATDTVSGDTRKVPECSLKASSKPGCPYDPRTDDPQIRASTWALLPLARSAIRADPQVCAQLCPQTAFGAPAQRCTVAVRSRVRNTPFTADLIDPVSEHVTECSIDPADGSINNTCPDPRHWRLDNDTGLTRCVCASGCAGCTPTMSPNATCPEDTPLGLQGAPLCRTVCPAATTDCIVRLSTVPDPDLYCGTVTGAIKSSELPVTATDVPCVVAQDVDGTPFCRMYPLCSDAPTCTNVTSPASNFSRLLEITRLEALFTVDTSNMTAFPLAVAKAAFVALRALCSDAAVAGARAALQAKYGLTAYPVPASRRYRIACGNLAVVPVLPDLLTGSVTRGATTYHLRGRCSLAQAQQACGQLATGCEQVAGIVDLDTCECGPGVVPRDPALSPHNRERCVGKGTKRACTAAESLAHCGLPGPVAECTMTLDCASEATRPASVPADLSQTYMSTVSAANVTGDDPGARYCNRWRYSARRLTTLLAAAKLAQRMLPSDPTLAVQPTDCAPAAGHLFDDWTHTADYAGASPADPRAHMFAALVGHREINENYGLFGGLSRMVDVSNGKVIGTAGQGRTPFFCPPAGSDAGFDTLAVFPVYYGYDVEEQIDTRGMTRKALMDWAAARCQRDPMCGLVDAGSTGVANNTVRVARRPFAVVRDTCPGCSRDTPCRARSAGPAPGFNTGANVVMRLEHEMRTVTGGALEGRVDASPWGGITRCGVGDEVCHAGDWVVLESTVYFENFPSGGHQRFAGDLFYRLRDLAGVDLMPGSRRASTVVGVQLADLYAYCLKETACCGVSYISKDDFYPVTGVHEREAYAPAIIGYPCRQTRQVPNPITFADVYVYNGYGSCGLGPITPAYQNGNASAAEIFGFRRKTQPDGTLLDGLPPGIFGFTTQYSDRSRLAITPRRTFVAKVRLGPDGNPWTMETLDAALDPSQSDAATIEMPAVPVPVSTLSKPLSQHSPPAPVFPLNTSYEPTSFRVSGACNTTNSSANCSVVYTHTIRQGYAVLDTENNAGGSSVREALRAYLRGNLTGQAGQTWPIGTTVRFTEALTGDSVNGGVHQLLLNVSNAVLAPEPGAPTPFHTCAELKPLPYASVSETALRDSQPNTRPPTCTTYRWMPSCTCYATHDHRRGAPTLAPVRLADSVAGSAYNGDVHAKMRCDALQLRGLELTGMACPVSEEGRVCSGVTRCGWANATSTGIANCSAATGRVRQSVAASLAQRDARTYTSDFFAVRTRNTFLARGSLAPKPIYSVLTEWAGDVVEGDDEIAYEISGGAPRTVASFDAPAPTTLPYWINGHRMTRFSEGGRGADFTAVSKTLVRDALRLLRDTPVIHKRTEDFLYYHGGTYWTRDTSTCRPLSATELLGVTLGRSSGTRPSESNVLSDLINAAGTGLKQVLLNTSVTRFTPRNDTFRLSPYLMDIAAEYSDAARAGSKCPNLPLPVRYWSDAGTELAAIVDTFNLRYARYEHDAFSMCQTFAWNHYYGLNTQWDNPKTLHRASLPLDQWHLSHKYLRCGASWGQIWPFPSRQDPLTPDKLNFNAWRADQFCPRLPSSSDYDAVDRKTWYSRFIGGRSPSATGDLARRACDAVRSLSVTAGSFAQGGLADLSAACPYMGCGGCPVGRSGPACQHYTPSNAASWNADTAVREATYGLAHFGTKCQSRYVGDKDVPLLAPGEDCGTIDTSGRAGCVNGVYDWQAGACTCDAGWTSIYTLVTAGYVTGASRATLGWEESSPGPNSMSYSSARYWRDQVAWMRALYGGRQGAQGEGDPIANGYYACLVPWDPDATVQCAYGVNGTTLPPRRADCEARSGTCVACSGRGTCIQNQGCVCKPGYYGLHCESPISDICLLGNGTRNVPQLPAGLSNATLYPCSAHGTCVLDRIDCTNASYPGIVADSVCTSVGMCACVQRPGYGWAGGDCSVPYVRGLDGRNYSSCENGGTLRADPPLADPTGGGNAFFDLAAIEVAHRVWCSCPFGYDGPRCELSLCPIGPNGLPCSGRGRCAYDVRVGRPGAAYYTCQTRFNATQHNTSTGFNFLQGQYMCVPPGGFNDTVPPGRWGGEACEEDRFLDCATFAAGRWHVCRPVGTNVQAPFPPTDGCERVAPGEYRCSCTNYGRTYSGAKCELDGCVRPGTVQQCSGYTSLCVNGRCDAGDPYAAGGSEQPGANSSDLKLSSLRIVAGAYAEQDWTACAVGVDAEGTSSYVRTAEGNYVSTTGSGANNNGGRGRLYTCRDPTDAAFGLGTNGARGYQGVCVYNATSATARCYCQDRTTPCDTTRCRSCWSQSPTTSSTASPTRAPTFAFVDSPTAQPSHQPTAAPTAANDGSGWSVSYAVAQPPPANASLGGCLYTDAPFVLCVDASARAGVAVRPNTQDMPAGGHFSYTIAPDPAAALGLAFDPPSGLLSGTPNATGTFVFNVTAQLNPTGGNFTSNVTRRSVRLTLRALATCAVPCGPHGDCVVPNASAPLDAVCVCRGTVWRTENASQPCAATTCVSPTRPQSDTGPCVCDDARFTAESNCTASRCPASDAGVECGDTVLTQEVLTSPLAVRKYKYCGLVDPANASGAVQCTCLWPYVRNASTGLCDAQCDLEQTAAVDASACICRAFSNRDRASGCRLPHCLHGAPMVGGVCQCAYPFDSSQACVVNGTTIAAGRCGCAACGAFGDVSCPAIGAYDALCPNGTAPACACRGVASGARCAGSYCDATKRAVLSADGTTCECGAGDPLHAYTGMFCNVSRCGPGTPVCAPVDASGAVRCRCVCPVGYAAGDAFCEGQCAANMVKQADGTCGCDGWNALALGSTGTWTCSQPACTSGRADLFPPYGRYGSLQSYSNGTKYCRCSTPFWRGTYCERHACGAHGRPVRPAGATSQLAGYLAATTCACDLNTTLLADFSAPTKWLCVPVDCAGGAFNVTTGQCDCPGSPDPRSCASGTPRAVTTVPVTAAPTLAPTAQPTMRPTTSSPTSQKGEGPLTPTPAPSNARCVVDPVSLQCVATIDGNGTAAAAPTDDGSGAPGTLTVPTAAPAQVPTAFVQASTSAPTLMYVPTATPTEAPSGARDTSSASRTAVVPAAALFLVLYAIVAALADL